jgi:sec-independent protein translocase protein TatA
VAGTEKGRTVHPVLAEIFGPDLLIVILVLAVVVFGGSKIPKLARSLGSAQSEFKKGLAEGNKATATDEADAKGSSTNGTENGRVAKTEGNGSSTTSG